MKRLLVLFVILAGALWAQPQQQVGIWPDCVQFYHFTAATQATASFDNRQVGCTDWAVVYSSSGFTALSLLVQSSADNAGVPAGWGAYAGSVVIGVNPNTATTSATTVLSGYQPWMRVYLSAVTGAGTIRGTLYGWKYRVARGVVRGPTLPTLCNIGDLFSLTVPVVGLYYCNPANTWAMLTTNVGTVTSSGPPTNHQVAIFDTATDIKGLTLPDSDVLVGVTGADPAPRSLADLNKTEYAVGGGVSDAQTVTLTPALTALTAGHIVRWLPIWANVTTTPTLAENGLAATVIKKCGASALALGDLSATAVAVAIYDGTQYQLQNPQAVPCGVSVFGGSTLTTVGAIPVVTAAGTLGESAVKDDGTNVVDVSARDWGLGVFARTGNTAPGKRLVVWGNGGIVVANPTTLGSESLNETGFATVLKWSKTGDFTITGGNAVYAHSSGAATLTQTAANQAVAAVGSRWYQFTYTLTAVTAGTACSVTTAYGDATFGLALDMTAGVGKLFYFTSATTPTDFVLSCTSTAGGFTMDNVSLKEVQGGDVALNGLITGGGTAGIKVAGNGYVGIGTTVTSAAILTLYTASALPALAWGASSALAVLTNYGGIPIMRSQSAADFWFSTNTSVYYPDITLKGGTDYVGIGTAAPVSKLEVYGVTTQDGAINWQAIPAPPFGPTAGTPTAGGSCTAGAHSWKVTFLNAAGENLPSAASAAKTCVVTSGQTVPLSVIPKGPDGTTGRNIYATKTGDSGSYYLIATSPVIANNTATTYSFTIADGSFTATVAPVVDTSAIGVMQVAGSPKLVLGGPVPTVTGCGAMTGMNTVGVITSATTGVCTPVLTFAATAATGWSCFINNQTHPGATNMMGQSATAPTTATFTGTTVSGDVLNYACFPY